MMTTSLKMTASIALLSISSFAMAASSGSSPVSQLAPQSLQIRVTDQTAFRNLVLSKSGAIVGVMNGQVRPLSEFVHLLDRAPAVICLMSSGAQVSTDLRFGDDLHLKSVRTMELSSSRETELTLASSEKMSIMAGCLKTDHSDLKVDELQSAFQGILEFSVK